MRFSEREGFKPVRTVFQIDSVDENLRNGLWTIIYNCVIRRVSIQILSGDTGIRDFLSNLWIYHYQKAVDQQLSYDEFLKFIRKEIFSGPWYGIYDFIEFVLSYFPFTSQERDSFRKACNFWLEREMSAWRVIGNTVTRLTSEEEIEVVEATCALRGPFTSASTHMNTALAHLSDRKSPDYRNSIKEAISAVESACRVVTENSKATLGDALKQLEKKGIRIHPALRAGFDKLYGYTSDEGGIRHSLLEQSTVDFEDAKFMAVSCSAFVNLLRARSGLA